MKRIICIGNRYVQEDAAGPRVYDRLRARTLPPGVEVVDGGLAGLNLLRFVDGAEHVVFVDAVCGFAPPGGLVVLEGDEVAALAGERYDHGAGLPYLLRMLPAACAGRVPRVQLVGVEAPASEPLIDGAAALALRALEGAPGARP